MTPDGLACLIGGVTIGIVLQDELEALGDEIGRRIAGLIERLLR